MVKLKQGQEEAIAKLRNGSILYGTVGSGKSLTSLVYYVRKCGGVEFEHIPFAKPIDLYIITPAAKRDKHEWDKELTWLLIGMQPNVKVTVDSWNNLHKYAKVKGAFFVFDEQRIVGSGTWVKSFLEIAKKNQFILLTATPGDVWIDYVPMFLANGFYESRRSFVLEHVVYHQYLSFPKIIRYNNIPKLEHYRDQLLVGIPNYSEEKLKHYTLITTDYDEHEYNIIANDRWDPWLEAPIKNSAEVCYLLRKACNARLGRIAELCHLLEKHRKLIVFYNFDYELDFIKRHMECEIAEYNGHKHQPVPTSDEWIYLVQYAAGAEAWNCITTDTVVFWSLNYSYRATVQAAGRIDRLDSPFTSLYYYRFVTRSEIDLGIQQALSSKKNFNERTFLK